MTIVISVPKDTIELVHRDAIAVCEHLERLASRSSGVIGQFTNFASQHICVRRGSLGDGSGMRRGNQDGELASWSAKIFYMLIYRPYNQFLVCFGQLAADRNFPFAAQERLQIV